jgi:hypothetical protein
MDPRVTWIRDAVKVGIDPIQYVRYRGLRYSAKLACRLSLQWKRKVTWQKNLPN